FAIAPYRGSPLTAGPRTAGAGGSVLGRATPSVPLGNSPGATAVAPAESGFGSTCVAGASPLRPGPGGNAAGGVTEAGGVTGAAGITGWLVTAAGLAPP